MTFFSKHTPAFGRSFLILYLLANSGFTVVVYRCTMPHCETAGDISGTACCTGMADCTSASCPELVGSQSPVVGAVTVCQPCIIATIAGGSFTDPTIVEEEFNGQQILKADLLGNAWYETTKNSLLDLTISYSLLSSSRVSTSSVETYVLNATFLI